MYDKSLVAENWGQEFNLHFYSPSINALLPSCPALFSELAKGLGKLPLGRKVSWPTNFYNLDLIISVGYRVKSLLRQRVTPWFNEYVVKGCGQSCRVTDSNKIRTAQMF